MLSKINNADLIKTATWLLYCLLLRSCSKIINFIIIVKYSKINNTDLIKDCDLAHARPIMLRYKYIKLYTMYIYRKIMLFVRD